MLLQIMYSSYSQRRNKLYDKIKGKAILLDGNNIFYLTGFMAAGIERLIALVIDDKKSYLIIPALHKNDVTNIDQSIQVLIWNDGEDPLKLLLEISGNAPVFVESSMPAYIYSKFKNKIEFIDSTISAMRAIKDNEEINNIKEAIKIAETSLEQLIPEIHEGISESELASLLDHNFIRNGAAGNAFPTIASFGKNAASPHHSPDNTLLQHDQCIVIDFGCVVGNYRSDETRTFFFGKPDEKFTAAYSILKKAQLAGCNYAGPGCTGKELDSYVHNIINQAGYGSYFIHRTGHGIGLNEHEEPFIDQNNEKILLPGNCITVEPGIYMPGEFGIRIEDTLIINSKGADVPEKFTKNLILI
ncbi:MAG: aminopeptidase P family protein [Ferroplasma sp.]